jgi:hypothetical protein
MKRIIPLILYSVILLFGGAGVWAADPSWESLSARCTEAGWSDSQIQQLADRTHTLEKQQVSPDLLYECVQEGLAKRVAPEQVLDVVMTRAALLNQANQLAQETDCRQDEVVQAVTLAMESGLSEVAVKEVLSAGRDRRTGQLCAVIETGETMYLNGVSEEVVSSLMQDFLQRNLRRSEMIRAARIAERSYENGMAPEAMRKSLWGANSVSGTGLGRGRSGTGAGQGYGSGGGNQSSRSNRRGKR